MDTSSAAYESMLPHVSRLAKDVYAAIEAAGARGMTCDECEVQLSMRHQTASARMRELKDRNLVVDSGKRRATRSGRQAAIMMIRGMPGGQCDHDRSKWVHSQPSGGLVRTACQCGKFMGYRNV